MRFMWWYWRVYSWGTLRDTLAPSCIVFLLVSSPWRSRNFVPSYPQQGGVVSVLSILHLTPLGRSSWSVRLLGSGGCRNCLVIGTSGVGCPEQVKRCARWTGVYQAGKGAEGFETVTFCDAFKISVHNFLSKFGTVQPTSLIVYFNSALSFLQQTIHTMKCGNTVVPNSCNVVGFFQFPSHYLATRQKMRTFWVYYMDMWAGVLYVVMIWCAAYRVCWMSS